jgi:hypothetical protein
MFGKIDYWSPEENDRKNKGYGFIVVHFEDGHIEKFFVLGSRLLFDKRPQIGDEVSFDVTDEKPRKDKGYPLVANVKLVKPANFACFTVQNPLGFVTVMSPLAGGK